VPTIVTAPTFAFRDVTPAVPDVSRLIVFAIGLVMEILAPAEVKVIAGPVWVLILVRPLPDDVVSRLITFAAGVVIAIVAPVELKEMLGPD
jgi:hypothetical protein